MTAHSRWNLVVTIEWPTSAFACWLWLVLGLALVAGPLILAYTVGRSAGQAESDATSPRRTS